jgi:hypothetical protein
MKAIRTHYSGPTDTRGSRITADDGDGNRISISYPYEMSSLQAHRKAADALCEKMEWSGPLVGGAYKNDYFWVWSRD